MLVEFIKGCMFFTGSYSNNVFPDPLSKEEEEEYLPQNRLPAESEA